VDLRRLTLAVELSASTPRLDEFLVAVDRETPISSAHARLQMKASGALATPNGKGTLSVSALRHGETSVGGIEIDAEAERLGMGDRRYRVTFAARTRELAAPEAVAQWLGSAPAVTAVARFGAMPKLFDVDALKLETATFGAELVGHATEEGSVEVSQIAVTWPDLRTAPALSDVVGAGALRVRGSATVTDAWTKPAVDAKLSAEGIDLELANAEARRVFGTTPKLSASLHYDRERGFAADTVRLLADALSADASVAVSTEGRVKAKADVEVPDVSVLAAGTPPPLAGAAVATLAVDGTIDAFDGTATVRSQGVRIRGAEPLAGDIAFTARGNRGAIAGDVDANLTFNRHPVRAGGRYAYDVARGSVRVEGLEASLPGVDAEASGEVQPSPLLLRGSARARGHDLAQAAALFGVDLAGSAEISLDLDHDGVRQRARVNATGRSIRFRDLSVKSAKLDVTPVAGGATSRFSLSADGNYRRDFVVSAAGTASGELTSADVTVDRLDGHYDEYSFSARRPLRGRFRDGGVALRDGALEIAGGVIEGEWGPGGLRGVGRIRFTGIPLAIVSLVRERATMLGHMSGEIARSKAGGALEVSAKTAGAGIASAVAPGGVARLELGVNASMSAWRTRIESSLAMADGELRFDAAADVPAGIEGADRRGKLAGRVSGALGAEMIGQMLLPEDDRLQGRLDVALDLGGTLQSPTATGRATGKVRYASAATGMDLRIEELDLRAEGQRLRIAALKGNDGRDGVIDGRGSVDFSAGIGDAVYDVEIAFLDTYLARIDEVRLRGDGALQLVGQGAAGQLKGGFTADEAILRMPDRLPPDVATIPVEHVNVEMSRNPPAIAEASAPAVPLGLDLALQFPGHLRVEDPNLDSEWRGELFVRGTTAAPDVQGKLTVLRGNFGLGGVQFRAREGSLSFDEASNVPTVDITAVANRNEIEATLHLYGRIDRAEIELRSEPPLPQDEILSRLMFGTAATTLTAGQSVQLAQAVARLSGRGPGIDVLGRVRRFVGVDRIEIKDSTDTSTGTTTTAVSVGKYVNDRIYVSLDQAVRGEGSKARVEVELTKHISAETEVGQNQNALVGLKWRWNY
jgi:translocation and assembly module TamB